MNKETVEYLKNKIENKERDLEKYKLYEKIFGTKGDSRSNWNSYRVAGAEYFKGLDYGEYVIKDPSGDEYYINLDYSPNELTGYGRPVWGDINIEKIEKDSQRREEIIAYLNDKNEKYNTEEGEKNRELVLKRDKDLNVNDVNLENNNKEQFMEDFYKRAERVYVAKTANSRIALYKLDDKYYVSERDLLITADGYDQILLGGYSKKDKIFEEVTPEEIEEIFGKEEIANEIYGKTDDIAIGYTNYALHLFKELKEVQDQNGDRYSDLSVDELNEIIGNNEKIIKDNEESIKSKEEKMKNELIKMILAQQEKIKEQEEIIKGLEGKNREE